MMKKKAQRKTAMGGLEWEMRPGGMLVQKRNLDSSDQSNSIPQSFTCNPAIRIAVKYNSSFHEIQINPHSTFGELKKMLERLTRVNIRDQKLIYKEKERDSKEFLDIVGVKDGSRLILMEETKFSDLTRSDSIEKAMKSVAEVTMEVDKLAAQVRRLEKVIINGGSVVEKEPLNMIEMFMSLLIRLDEIVAYGDAKLQRKAQVMRIQRYIEALDKLKVKNEATQQEKKLLRLQRHQRIQELR